MDDDFGFADAFALGFERAAGAVGRLEHEDGVAAAGFGFDQFAGGFAADFFVGGPEEDDAFARLFAGGQFLQGLRGEEGLDDAGFHVEGAGAVGFAGGDAEGHFSQRAGDVDGVVVAEDQKLAGGAVFRRGPGDAQVIAALILGGGFWRDSFDARAAQLRHALAMTAQHRSIGAFSKLGDSVTTNCRSSSNISGSRGVKCWSRTLGRGVSAMGATS